MPKESKGSRSKSRRRHPLQTSLYLLMSAAAIGSKMVPKGPSPSIPNMPDYTIVPQSGSGPGQRQRYRSCSACGAKGVNKLTCPYNPKATYKRPDQHN